MLVRQAKRAGITLRQAHTRLAKKAAIKAGRHADAPQYCRMKRELRRLPTYLGPVYRDVSRKIAGDEILQARGSAVCFGLVERLLLAQQPKAEGQEQAVLAARAVGRRHR